MPGFSADVAYEVVWLLAAALGFLVNVYALHDAVEDVRALEQAQRNGVRLLIARGRVRQDWVRVIVQVVLIAAAMRALDADPVRTAPHHLTVLTLMDTPLVMAALSCLTVVEALMAVRLRARLIAMLDAAHPPGV